MRVSGPDPRPAHRRADRAQLRLATSPASPPPPRAGSRRSRAPGPACSTPARRCPTGARCRSTPCAAAAASTTASASPTWRWSRTTTCSPRAAWCRRSRPSAPRYPDLPVEVEVTDLDQLRELLDVGCERILLDNMTDEMMAEAVAHHRRSRDARGLRRSHPRPRPRRRRDRRRLHLGRRADPLGDRLRHRDGPADDPPLRRHRQLPHRHRAPRRRRGARPLAGGDRRASYGGRVGGAAQGPAPREQRLRPRSGGISVCATVPAVLHEWRDMLVRHYGTLPNVVVEPGVRTGVPVLMDNPREVGADRVINALAAATLYDGPGDRRRLRHRHDLRRGQPARGVHRRRHRPRHRHLARGARPPRRPAAQGRAAPPAHGDRQEHRRGAPVGHGLRLRQPGRRHRRPDDRGARRTRRRRST